MKNHRLLLASIALLASFSPITINAATQVYDLKDQWSDTQNPNGPWTYRTWAGLMVNDPFPWVNGPYLSEVITKITENYILPEWVVAEPGFLEVGDIFVISATYAGIRWTSPASGIISIAGSTWASQYMIGSNWALTHNGDYLSGGEDAGLRSSPMDLSLGSAGADALVNIAVAAGDQVELAFTGGAIGLNFTVLLTPDSVDPVAAIEALATTVINMNLQNGIENSLDTKLDAALNALIDVNVSNDGAAYNSLTAFINAVEAQRGNKITSQQADQLIDAAHQIQALL